MFLNEDIVDIEKPDGIYSLKFAVEEFRTIAMSISLFYCTFAMCINSK